MENTTPINCASDLTALLEKAFDCLNQDLFNGLLPKPVITISPTKKAYGHYTCYDAWSVLSEPKREINISSYTTDKPIKEVVSTLVHEMCHMYNDLILQRNDCSNNGRYHNKLFKSTAESHWLEVEKSSKYGWCITKPTKELTNWINNQHWLQDIQMYKKMRTEEEERKKKPKKQFTYHYKCICGNECKSINNIMVICTKCNSPMVLF